MMKMTRLPQTGPIELDHFLRFFLLQRLNLLVAALGDRLHHRRNRLRDERLDRADSLVTHHDRLLSLSMRVSDLVDAGRGNP